MEDYAEEIATLAKRYQNASGFIIKLANLAGSHIEFIANKVPDEIEQNLQNIVKDALAKAHDVSNHLSSHSYAPTVHRNFYKVTGTATGAITGTVGNMGALADVPTVIMIMFGSFQKIATEYGFERSDEETKIECLKVFSMGGPLEEDEDLDLTFATKRLALSGQVVGSIITVISERLSITISQKLIASAVPLIGAFMGAALNFAFISYYEEMAHIRFRLKQLQIQYPDSQPASDFVLKLKET